ncbi:MAG TPA: ABC transporter ATP-binding protein [Thermoanaerobaculia bacterium]|nr:ABC transporter ATP-binding protein [Thermoanaerobaculia bacterium]
MSKARKAAVSDRAGMMRLVRELLRPYRGWLAIILAAMLVETAMSLAGPWPLKIVLDSVIGHRPMPDWVARWLGPNIADHKMGLAGLAAALIVLIAVFENAASYIDNYYTESVGQYVANDLRMRVYQHLDRLSLGYYDKQQTGNLLSTITTDITTIQSFASGSTLSILVDILTIIGMLGLMFWLNFDFTLIAVAVTPFLLLFVSRFKKAVKKATHEVRHRQSDIVSVVQEGLESMRVVKAYGRETLEEDHLKQASQAAVDAALKARRIKSALSPVVAIVVALCTGFVLYRGSYLILHDAMTIGALTVFLSYLSKFFKPVQDLAKMTNSIAQAAVAVERVQTILAADEMTPEKPDALEPTGVKGEITFDKVAFAYKPDSPVLKEITFKIEPGQLVGFVGATGGGKSTVASLIPRFYDANQGRVLIDGTDVKDFKLKALRKQIGCVLQDTVLFAGTIAENIAYGRPGATREEVVAAAELANADEFISRMPKGYDSEVGERGMTLSGGQRQRIGIARAIIRNSPILILDEPTAALDTESEKIVMEALERLMKGRTAIAIAHRLSTIKDADKIVVFKDGFVHEQGTHEELLGKNGLYAELYRVQFPTEAGVSPAPAAAGPVAKA